MSRDPKRDMPFYTQFNLWTGFFVTGTIVVALMILQTVYPMPLGLESRWLVAASAPILIALIIGGYISRVKVPGGIELFLAQPVSNLSLSATSSSSLTTPKGMTKGSPRNLLQLTADQAALIERLVLTEGLPDFYGVEALTQYIERLPSLQFIEVQSRGGKFVALIPIDVVKNASYFDPNNNLYIGIRLLIKALDDSNVLEEYRNSAILNTATSTSGIIETLKLMRKFNTDKLVIIDSEGKFKGLLLEKDLEKRLVDLILQESPDSH